MQEERLVCQLRIESWQNLRAGLVGFFVGGDLGQTPPPSFGGSEVT